MRRETRRAARCRGDSGLVRQLTLSQRGTPRYASPSDRSVTVISRVAIYRAIGRRPSQVYVDEAMRPAASGHAARRLSDQVFWRMYAEPGDQIEERSDGFLLLTEPMQCHPIQLSEPRPLDVATAFTHAEIVLRQDRDALAALLAQGAVVEGTPKRPRTVPSRVANRIFAEDHPLVVETPPEDLDTEPPEPSMQGRRRHPRRSSSTGW